MVLTAVAGDELPDRETIAEIEAVLAPFAAAMAVDRRAPSIRCPFCAFAYPMMWCENAEVTRPPNGADPLRWVPWSYTALFVLCTSCGWKVERIV